MRSGYVRGMRIPRLVSTLLAVAVLPVSLVAIAPAGNTASSAIVIAVEAPITGDQASNGVDMLRGVQLAVKQVNASGGVMGRKIRIVALDDQANPDLGPAMVAKAAKAGAVAVIGPYNSAVGAVNLPMFVKKRIVVLRMTSIESTQGYGVTTQPMDSQTAPVQVDFIVKSGAKRVTMLVDPSQYTVSMATRVAAALKAKGIAVTQLPIVTGAADYTADVTAALATTPDLIYSSTYYPEGTKIAKAINDADTEAACFMGLANVDPAFVTDAGVAVSQRCTFGGTPAAAQLPKAGTYVKDYRKAFGAEPGVWGTFTFDSAMVLFAAMDKAKTTAYAPLRKAVSGTKKFPGATGSITFTMPTGDRTVVPVFVLVVNDKGTFVIED
jgi:branched-chain amino acid transport system substrate-binding protein